MKHLLVISIVLVVFITGCKKDKPATVATLTTTTISSITSVSAITGGTITDDGGAGVSKRGVCLAMHANPTVGDSITTDGTGTGTFISNLSGLSANVTYYVKAYAINSAGTAYGNELSFTSSKGVPSLTTTPVTNIVATTATGTGGGNVTNDGGAAVSARGVVWGTAPNPTIINFKTSDGTGTGTFTSTLNQLLSNTTYYVRAYATNSFGTGYGNQQTFTTGSVNTVADIDGNVYGTITIGTQTWTTSNLRVTRYRNGDPIINGFATPGYSFPLDTTGAYTFPNKDTSNNSIYGKLYNIWSVKDPRNIAPIGWHVPSDADWKVLEQYEGMSPSELDNLNYRGTIAPLLFVGGSSGLNLQNGGYISGISGNVIGFGTQGWFSTSTYFPANNTSFFRAINNQTGNPLPVYRNAGSQVVAVRCVKD